MIFYFIVTVVQYIYLCGFLYFNPIVNILSKITYEYNIDGINHQATIYKTNNKSKKLLLIISGGYKLSFEYYIQKLLYDTRDNPYLNNKTGQYEIVIFEKPDKSSITIYKDVAEYIKTLNTENKLEELIILGFSAGGVVSSHIMSELNNYSFKKKLITYDTPWQVTDNVLSFKNNFIYRPDILFFNIVHEIYSNHYNVSEIKQHLIKKSNNIINGSVEMVDMIKKIHKFSNEEMYNVTPFNMEQTTETSVINIYCKYDPFVNRIIHDEFMLQNKSIIKFPIYNIQKDHIGHCSDLISTNYLHDILRAILM